MLNISGFLENTISKPIYEYTQEEWTLQKDVLTELIVRMGNVEQDNKGNVIKNKYHFYTIEDLKRSIKALGKEEKLRFEENFTSNDFNMKLYSEEGVIMKLMGKIVAKENASIKEYKATDYNLELTYLVYKKEKVTKEEITIPLITQNEGEFKSKIAQIGGHLEMDLYSNNNKEHLKILQAFMKPYYPHIQIQTIENKENHLTFKMTNEERSLNGVFNYLPEKGELGGYHIQILQPETQNVEKEFEFVREYKKTLSEEFKKNGFDRLFVSIHEEILQIFEEEYMKIIFPLRNEKLSSSQSSSGLFNNGPAVYLRTTSKLEFSVEPTEADIKMQYKLIGRKYTTNQSFSKKVFNREQTRKLFENLLTTSKIVFSASGERI